MRQNNIVFLPQEINVGYQNRSDTYSGKLAYVTYFDENQVLRKENSWNGWRDIKIPNNVIKNEPMSGFVLNKQVGGYSGYWHDRRQSYVRVYDPRGFEFEITPQNLMYILENANSYKGKGLDGEFVYGWSGTELILVPVGDPKFCDYQAYSDLLYNKKHFKGSDLKVGFEYKLKDGSNVIYMGRYHTKYTSGEISKTEQFIFYTRTSGYSTSLNSSRSFDEKTSISKNLIVAELSDDKVDDYLDILSRMQNVNHILTSGGVSWLKAKDLKVGHKYKLNNGSYGVYMGKFHSISDDDLNNHYGRSHNISTSVSEKPEFVFYTVKKNLKRDKIFNGWNSHFFEDPKYTEAKYSNFLNKPSISKFVIEEISDDVVVDYEDLKLKIIDDEWVVTDHFEGAA